jgi:hypothetical protein
MFLCILKGRDIFLWFICCKWVFFVIVHSLESFAEYSLGWNTILRRRGVRCLEIPQTLTMETNKELFNSLCEIKSLDEFKIKLKRHLKAITYICYFQFNIISSTFMLSEFLSNLCCIRAAFKLAMLNWMPLKKY